MSLLLTDPEVEAERRKRQRHLRARFDAIVKPHWFNRRFMEETKLTGDDLFVLKVTSETGRLLTAPQLDLVESFIRRFMSGAITENAGELVEDPRSPFQGTDGSAAPKPPGRPKKIVELGHEKPLPIEKPVPPPPAAPAKEISAPSKLKEHPFMSTQISPRQRQITDRFGKIEKPPGWLAKFGRAANVRGSTAQKFYKVLPLADAVLDRIEDALNDRSWENGETRKAGRKPKAEKQPRGGGALETPCSSSCGADGAHQRQGHDRGRGECAGRLQVGQGAFRGAGLALCTATLD